MHPDEAQEFKEFTSRRGLASVSPRLDNSRPETERAMDFLAEEIERTHKLVEMLLQKLAPVIAPAPEGSKSGVPIEGYASALASNIASKAAAIASANQKLLALHSSVQL